MFTSVSGWVCTQGQRAAWCGPPFGILAFDSVYVRVLFSGALGTWKHGWVD